MIMSNVGDVVALVTRQSNVNTSLTGRENLVIVGFYTEEEIATCHVEYILLSWILKIEEKMDRILFQICIFNDVSLRKISV